MENYPISINFNNQVHRFEVGEYLHHEARGCKIKVFREGKFVAGFEPDHYQYLQVCQNPGALDEDLLDLMADQIEAHHPHGINQDLDE